MKRNSGNALVVVAIIVFVLAMGVMAVVSLVNNKQFRDAVNQSPSLRPSASLKENLNNMDQAAKVHYDKTQELFKQARTITDEKKLKPICDEIITEAKLAIDAQPKNPLLWSNLGDAYGWPNTLGTADDSLAAYQKAFELDPNNVYIQIM